MENMEITDLLYEAGEHLILAGLELSKGNKKAAIVDKNAAAELMKIVQSLLVL